jgi:hypothetical protein
MVLVQLNVSRRYEEERTVTCYSGAGVGAYPTSSPEVSRVGSHPSSGGPHFVYPHFVVPSLRSASSWHDSPHGVFGRRQRKDLSSPP